VSELSLEAFAEVSAELAAGGRLMPVLERHGLSEPRWRSVQSIWLVRLAEEAGRQRYKLNDRYQKAFLRHMERLDRSPPARDTQPPAASGGALPFQAPAAPVAPRESEPVMELAHFAALTAELTVHPYAVERAVATGSTTPATAPWSPAGSRASAPNRPSTSSTRSSSRTTTPGSRSRAAEGIRPRSGGAVLLTDIKLVRSSARFRSRCDPRYERRTPRGRPRR